MKFSLPLWVNVTRLIDAGGVNGSVTVWPLPSITTGGTGVDVAGIGLGVAVGSGVLVGLGVFVGAAVLVGLGKAVGCGVLVGAGLVLVVALD